MNYNMTIQSIGGLAFEEVTLGTTTRYQYSLSSLQKVASELGDGFYAETITSEVTIKFNGSTSDASGLNVLKNTNWSENIAISFIFTSSSDIVPSVINIIDLETLHFKIATVSGYQNSSLNNKILKVVNKNDKEKLIGYGIDNRSSLAFTTMTVDGISKRCLVTHRDMTTATSSSGSETMALIDLESGETLTVDTMVITSVKTNIDTFIPVRFDECSQIVIDNLYFAIFSTSISPRTFVYDGITYATFGLYNSYRSPMIVLSDE